MINDFITHLTTELVIVNGYQTVAHAWDVEPFDAPDRADLPAALAFIGRDNSEPSGADNLVRQRRTVEVWVYTVCAHADLDAMRDRLFDAALGWQAAFEWDSLQHERGEVRKISGDYIWWLDVFTTWRQQTEVK